MMLRENFLILTFLDDHFEVNYLKADFTNKKIQVLDVKEEEYSSREKLKHIFLTAFGFRPYKLILAADSKRAATNYETFNFLREDPHKPISEAEIDYIISQALWKIFEEGRKLVGKQLGLGEMEVLLADTQVHDFQIDASHLVNPLKHKGRKIEVCLSQTFINRSFFDQIISMLPKWAKLALVIEAGSAASHLISRYSNKKKFLFAKVMAKETDLFLVSRDEGLKISFFDYFEWGKSNLWEDIGKEFRVSPGISKEILVKYAEDGMSEEFERRFDRIFRKEIIEFERGISQALSRAKKDFALLDFPPLIPAKIFSKMILPIDSGEVMSFFGFSFKNNNWLNLNNSRKKMDFLSLAGFFEYYFLPEEDLISHFAKRRMRWLMP